MVNDIVVARKVSDEGEIKAQWAFPIGTMMEFPKELVPPGWEIVPDGN